MIPAKTVATTSKHGDRDRVHKPIGNHQFHRNRRPNLLGTDSSQNRRGYDQAAAGQRRCHNGGHPRRRAWWRIVWPQGVCTRFRGAFGSVDVAARSRHGVGGDGARCRKLCGHHLNSTSWSAPPRARCLTWLFLACQSRTSTRAPLPSTIS